jgi:hypothetical protein
LTNTVTTLGRSRSVTKAEVAHYADHGWVKLDALVGPETVEALLSLARDKLGNDADSNPANPRRTVGFLNSEWIMGIEQPAFADLIASLGSCAKDLLGRNVGVRYAVDSVVAKLPAGRSHRHNASEPTVIHQDLPTWPLDRTGGMTIWIALADIGEENGTMQFLSGSHRMGPLAGLVTHLDRDLTELYPRLAEQCPSSGHLRYKAGDATVHADLCAHGAGLNLSDDPRWAYIIIFLPEDATWTGGPSNQFSTEGLTVYQPLPDERFPVFGGDEG